MLVTIIKKIYRTSFRGTQDNWIVLIVDIVTKVTINIKSNKIFWHTKPEILKGKLQKCL